VPQATSVVSTGINNKYAILLGYMEKVFVTHTYQFKNVQWDNNRRPARILYAFSFNPHLC